MVNLVLNILKEKCPFCANGAVFRKSKFLHLPEMNSECPVCSKDFIGEPGYYFGAMYISYGISVGAAIIMFLSCRFILGIESINVILTACISSIILISFKNFKWSRIVWLKIFPPGPNTNFMDVSLTSYPPATTKP